MNVAVIGAGKMGLPLACQFAHRGAQVVALDVRQDVVDAINRGECLIDEPGLPALLANTVAAGRLKASTDVTASTRQAEVVVVIVPVLLTKQRYADLSIIESVSRQIAAGIKPGMMISYETTLPVGQTRQLGKLLESGGLQAGRDFDLVFSPERVKSQFVLDHLMRNPKVVGGVTPQAATRAAQFYGTYLGAPVINVGTLEAAEMVKLAGMVYRDVNIALTNELAHFAELAGVDYHQVLHAANNDGEAALLSPGIGVGGHCTPVYPYFLIHSARARAMAVELAEAGRRINDDQPRRLLSRLEAAWGPVRGKKVLILGLGFRPQVKEHIFSPAFQIRDDLVSRGANVLLHDPLYSEEEIRDLGFTGAILDPFPPVDAVVLNTAHSAYAHIPFEKLAPQGLKAVLDGRAFWKPETVTGAGLVYVGVGWPGPPEF